MIPVRFNVRVLCCAVMLVLTAAAAEARPERGTNAMVPTTLTETPTSAEEILRSIDGARLLEISRYGSEEELALFLEPTVAQVTDYALNVYGEDVGEELAGFPEGALLLTVFYFGRENGISADDIENGGGCSSAKITSLVAAPFDCFLAALDSVLGISDIRALYNDFMHGVSANTVLRAVKQMGKRIWWSVSLVVAVYDLGDCMGLW